MLKLKMTDYIVIYEKSFPHPYQATNEQLEKALYEWELWGNEEGYYYIVSFEDIKAEFEGWTEEERIEYGIENYTIHDFIRECMRNVASVVYEIRHWER